MNLWKNNGSEADVKITGKKKKKGSMMTLKKNAFSKCFIAEWADLHGKGTKKTIHVQMNSNLSSWLASIHLFG